MLREIGHRISIRRRKSRTWNNSLREGETDYSKYERTRNKNVGMRIAPSIQTHGSNMVIMRIIARIDIITTPVAVRLKYRVPHSGHSNSSSLNSALQFRQRLVAIGEVKVLLAHYRVDSPMNVAPLRRARLSPYILLSGLNLRG